MSRDSIEKVEELMERVKDLSDELKGVDTGVDEFGQDSLSQVHSELDKLRKSSEDPNSSAKYRWADVGVVLKEIEEQIDKMERTIEKIKEE